MIIPDSPSMDTKAGNMDDEEDEEIKEAVSSEMISSIVEKITFKGSTQPKERTTESQSFKLMLSQSQSQAIGEESASSQMTVAPKLPGTLPSMDIGQQSSALPSFHLQRPTADPNETEDD